MTNFGIPALKSEGQLRDDLAASCRIFHRYGWDNYLLSPQHLSIRVVSASENNKIAFLITPTKLVFDQIRARDLVLVHVKLLPNGEYQVIGTYDEEFLESIDLHVHFHVQNASNLELQCLFQCQTIATAALASMQCGLLPVCQASCFSLQGGAIQWNGSDLRYCPVTSQHRVVLSQAFGAITAGRAAAEAFHYMFYTTSACEMQIKASSATLSNLSFPSHAVAITDFAGTMERFQRQGLGHDIFYALCRSLPIEYKQ